jgi:FKBP-type peptidyl-prolyl cis-trans isomerase (trigger factor)
MGNGLDVVDSKGSINNIRLHPADVKQAYEKLSKKYPKNKVLEELSKMSNDELLSKSSQGYSKGLLQADYMDEDSFKWIYE